jgi:hypothetical protein
VPHAGSKNYKGLLKAVLRLAMDPLSVDDAKEVEQAVAGAPLGGALEGSPVMRAVAFLRRRP